MNARARFAPSAEPGLSALVDDAFLGDDLRAVAHPQDWPDWQHGQHGQDEQDERDGPDVQDSGASPDLPRQFWDRALGDIARDILARPSRQFRARLCNLAWRLADGAGDAPPTLPAIVEVVHAGSLIVDDIEDGSRERRGAPAAHVAYGLPRALNAGNWMYFWALRLVDRLPDQSIPPAARDRIRRALGDTMYDCHLGQALDLSTDIGHVPRRWVYRVVATSTMLKTGALMQFAARMGAIAAGASPDRIDALARFGRRLGLGLQMLDDFGNLTAPAAEDVDSKALEDLRHARPTWPWALASRELDEPTFTELQIDVRALMDRGDTDGTHARALGARLRIAVGAKGRRQAGHYLRAALSDLTCAVGDRRELALLAAEIERLEASYG